MKYIVLLFIGLTLIGCQDIDNQYIDTSTYDLYDADTNIKVRFSTETTYPIEVFIYDWWDIQTCSGLSTLEPLFIDVVTNGSIASDGLYYLKYSVIKINERYVYNNYLLKHEMLHHLLYNNNMAKESKEHSSYLFDKCVPGTIVK